MFSRLGQLIKQLSKNKFAASCFVYVGSGGQRTFAAVCTEVRIADKAAIDYGGASGCFSNTAPAAKSAMGGFRNFAALRSKDSFGARF